MEGKDGREGGRGGKEGREGGREGGKEGGFLLTCCRRSSFSFTSSSVRGSAESICSCSCVCASSGSGRSGFSTAWGRGEVGRGRGMPYTHRVTYSMLPSRVVGNQQQVCGEPHPQRLPCPTLRSHAPPTKESSPVSPKESHAPYPRTAYLVSNGLAVSVNLLLQQLNEPRREELKVLYYRLLWGAGSLWAGQGGAEGSVGQHITRM